MPPKKRGGFGRKSANAQYVENFWKNLSPNAKEKLRKSTKESTQRYRKNLTEDKKIEIKKQDLEYQIEHLK